MRLLWTDTRGRTDHHPHEVQGYGESTARSVKDLPVKLQFRTPNPKALLEKIVKAGGSAVTMTASTGAGEGTLYAKDLEGYLLEIVKGSSIGLSAVAYGSPNVTASGAFLEPSYRSCGKTDGEDSSLGYCRSTYKKRFQDPVHRLP